MNYKAIVATTMIIAAVCSCGPRQQKNSNTVTEPETAPLDSIELKYAPVLELGTKAPEVSAADTLGNTVKLSDFLGNYVVMDFWATWCRDCRHELPIFKEVYENYKDATIGGAAVKFLSVSFDRDEQAWKDMVKEEGLAWTQIGDIRAKWTEGEIAKDYQIGWIPTFYLIDPEGKIIAKGIYASRMDEALKALK